MDLKPKADIEPLSHALVLTQAILKAANNRHTSVEAKGIRIQILTGRREKLINNLKFSQPGDAARSALIQFLGKAARQKISAMTN